MVVEHDPASVDRAAAVEHRKACAPIDYAVRLPVGAPTNCLETAGNRHSIDQYVRWAAVRHTPVMGHRKGS